MTYVTMQTRIANEISRSDLSDEIKNSIQSAIKHYERRRFYFNETVDTFSTVANQQWYEGEILTDSRDVADIIEIDSMTVSIGNDSYELDPRAYSWMDAVHLGTNFTGDPTDYAYYRQQIRLFPTPGQVRTVTVSYLRRLDALSEDADTNAWMTDGESLIRLAAKIDLYTNVIRNYEAAQALYPMLGQVESGLVRETESRAQGTVRAWG